MLYIQEGITKKEGRKKNYYYKKVLQVAYYFQDSTGPC
jgi:hypothetical protein